MRLALNIIAVLLLVVGGVWVLQGVDVLSGSAMSGQTQWLIAGIVAVFAGIGLLVFVARWQKREPQ
jgi:hypothetical protein